LRGDYIFIKNKTTWIINVHQEIDDTERKPQDYVTNEGFDQEYIIFIGIRFDFPKHTTKIYVHNSASENTKPRSLLRCGVYLFMACPFGGWVVGVTRCRFCDCRRGIIKQINSVDAREISYYDTGSGWGKSNCSGLLREGG
jgi:hypothetical protein